MSHFSEEAADQVASQKLPLKKRLLSEREDGAPSAFEAEEIDYPRRHLALRKQELLEEKGML